MSECYRDVKTLTKHDHEVALSPQRCTEGCSDVNLPCRPAAACESAPGSRGTSAPAGPGRPRCRGGSSPRGTSGGTRGQRWASPACARAPPWRRSLAARERLDYQKQFTHTHTHTNAA